MRVAFDDGRNVLAVGDVERGAIADLMDWARNTERGLPGTVDAVYTDPPWNPGIARIFRRWAGREHGAVDLGFLFAAFVNDALAACPYGPWYIEMGRGGVHVMQDTLAQFDVGVTDVLLTTNDDAEANAEAYVIEADPTEPARDAIVHPRATGLNGTDLRRTIMGTFPERGIRTVLDPFAGYGGILREAATLDIGYYGLELNADRLQRAIDFLNTKGA